MNKKVCKTAEEKRNGNPWKPAELYTHLKFDEQVIRFAKVRRVGVFYLQVLTNTLKGYFGDVSDMGLKGKISNSVCLKKHFFGRGAWCFSSARSFII